MHMRMPAPYAAACPVLKPHERLPQELKKQHDILGVDRELLGKRGWWMHAAACRCPLVSLMES